MHHNLKWLHPHQAECWYISYCAVDTSLAHDLVDRSCLKTGFATKDTRESVHASNTMVLLFQHLISLGAGPR